MFGGIMVFGVTKASGETGTELQPGNGVGGKPGGCEGCAGTSGSSRGEVVIGMAYGKDHHHFPGAYRLSVYADHQHGFIWWLR